MTFDYAIPQLFDPYAILGLALAVGAALVIVSRRHPDPRGAMVWGFFSIALGLRAVLVHFIQSGTRELVGPADALTAMALSAAVCAALLHLRWRVVPWQFACGAACLFALVVLVRLHGSTALFHAFIALVSAGALAVGAGAFLIAWRRERAWQNLMAGVAALSLIGAVAAYYSGLLDDLFVVSLLRAAMLLVMTVSLLSLLQRRQIEHLRQEVETRRRAEERFRDIAETTSDWLWESDVQHRVTYISPRVSEVTQRDGSIYVGKTRREQEGIVDDEGLAEYERLMAARLPYREVVLRTVSPLTGKLHTYTLSGKPAFDANGIFLGYRGSGRDVSDQLEARAISEAILGGVGSAVGTEYMHALVAHLARTLDGDAVFIGALDASRTRIEAFAIHSVDGSQRAAAYDTRGTPSDVIVEGRVCAYASGVTTHFPEDQWLRAFGAEGYVGVPLLDARGVASGVLTLVRRRPIANVETIVAVLRAHAVRVGAEVDRQIADHRVRESEARFRSLIDNMPITFSISDREGRYLVINRSFESWLCLGSEDVIGRTFVELRDRLGLTDQHIAEMQRDRELVWADGVPRQHEQRRRLADGVERDLAVSIFPIRDAAGEPVALGVVATDVSALKRMERSFAEARRAEALGRFASGIAHDFNNIVGAIGGFAQFLREDAAPASPTRHYADRILDASARAKDIIQQILGYARRQGPQLELIDLPTLMQDTLGFVDTIAAGQDVSAPRSWPEAALEVDRTQFTQVMMNLHSNAAHAMRGRAGAIEVSATLAVAGRGNVAARPAATEIVSEPDGAVRLTAGEVRAGIEYVVVTVADQGIGMSRDVLERILDPFFTTKGRGEGTGLGIPVVHGIVLSHGGALSIRSKPGAFTAVELWFPTAQVGEAERVPATAADDSGKVRVLVVDDDEGFAEMLGTGLERLGYSAFVVNHPATGLQAFRNAPAHWDAVVTDQNMPAMTGLELVERIKELRPVAPCIVCSGNADALSETAVRAAGADAYLRKPVDPGAVAKVIEGLLEIRRASAA